MPKFVLQIRHYLDDDAYDVSLYEDGRFQGSDGYTALVDAKNRAKEGSEVSFRFSTVEEDNGKEREISVRKGKVTPDGKLVSSSGRELKLEEAKSKAPRRRSSSKKAKASHLLEISYDESGKRSEKLFSLKDGEKLKVEIPEGENEIDYAFDIAANGGKIEYRIHAPGQPVESGTITKEGEMFSQPVAEAAVGPDRGEPLTESISESDVRFDWALEIPYMPKEMGKKKKSEIYEEAVLYGDEREDLIETDRYPKHKEIYGIAAINKAKNLAKAEAEGKEIGGIAVDVGKGSRKLSGFLRYKDGKFIIEVEKSGKFIDLVESSIGSKEEISLEDFKKLAADKGYEVISKKIDKNNFGFSDAHRLIFKKDGKTVYIPHIIVRNKDNSFVSNHGEVLDLIDKYKVTDKGKSCYF